MDLTFLEEEGIEVSKPTCMNVKADRHTMWETTWDSIVWEG